MPSASSRGFQAPRHVPSPEGCFFYHSIELPGHGLQVGDWDLRHDIDAYLGGQDWAGRLVVDVGTASGYVSLELERRGAEVIAFDRPLDDRSDEAGIVPFANFEEQFGRTLEEAIVRRLATQRRLQDSFWLSHRLYGSQIRLYCGNVYDGLPGVGEVDVSFFGCILLHLRDPLLALTRFGRISREAVVITEIWEDVGALETSTAMFLRASLGDRSNFGTWWWPTPALLQRFLEILGFRRFALSRHQARHVAGNRDVPLYTLVARR